MIASSQATSIGAPVKRSGATFTELLEARKRQRQEEAQAQEVLHAALLQQLVAPGAEQSPQTQELLAELTQLQALSSYEAAASSSQDALASRSSQSQSHSQSASSASSAGQGTADKRGPYKVALCMYHATKGCTKGADCTFAHGEEELLVHVSAQGGPNKAVMCKFFQQGVCRNGSMCRFAHTAEEMLAEAPGTGRTNKSIPCKFFEAGYCGRGELCNFYHDESKAKVEAIAQTEEQLVEALMQQQMLELLSQQAAADDQSQAAQAGLAELMVIREMQKQAAAQNIAGRPASTLLGAAGNAVDKRSVCMFWQRGGCKHGESCPFKHSDDGASPAAPAPGPQPYKVTICTFWQEGKCVKGADCTFAHGEEEIGMPPQPKTQFSADSFVVEPEPSTVPRKVAPPRTFGTLLEAFGTPASQPPARLPVEDQSNEFIEVPAEAYQEIAALMCKSFEQGNCRSGDACAYAHTGLDLIEGLNKMGICRRSLQGECTALPGRCQFQHIPDEQLTVVQHVASGQLTLTPCKNYSLGHCSEGYNCRFMHEGAPLAAPFRGKVPKVVKPPPSFSAPAVIAPAGIQHNPTPAGPADAKQMMCKFFQKGLCFKGDACIYAHYEEQLQIPEKADIGKFKTQMCPNFEIGYCAKAQASSPRSTGVQYHA